MVPVSTRTAAVLTAALATALLSPSGAGPAAPPVLGEQVRDRRLPTGEAARFGPRESTFSARPLAWMHAQFLRLARSVDGGYPVETPQVVACRYGSELCRR